MPVQLASPWLGFQIPEEPEPYADPLFPLELGRYPEPGAGRRVESLGFVVVDVPRALAGCLRAMDRTDYGRKR